jgi:excisionase family DNA binding protein
VIGHEEAAVNQDRALSISTIAKRLDVCERTARRLVESGDLRAIRVGRQWRILPRDFEEYLSRPVKRDAA